MNTKNDKGENYTIIYSGQNDTHHRGVILITNRESANTLKEWEPINKRLIKILIKILIVSGFLPHYITTILGQILPHL